MRPALLLFLIASACSDRTPPPPSTGVVCGGPASNPTNFVGIEGTERVIVLQQPLSKCSLDPATTSVDVEVLSPFNLAVDVPVDIGPYDPETGTRQITVHLLAKQPGTWQIIATFDPSLGRVQVAVDIARTRLDTPRWSIDLPFEPTACWPQPWRTTAGAVLCQLGATAYVFRDGIESKFDSDALSVLGNTIWSSRDTTLTRFTDTGAAFQIDAQVKLKAPPSPELGYSTETLAIRGYSNSRGHERFDFVDGGLVLRELPGEGYGRVFADDEGIWSISTVSNQSSETLCLLMTESKCRPLNGSALLRNSHGLWRMTGTPLKLVLETPPLTRGGATELTLPLGSQVNRRGTELLDRGVVVINPYEVGPAYTATAEAGGVVLNFYGPGTLLGGLGDYVVINEGKWRVTFAEP